MIRAKAVKKIQNLKKESPKNKKTQRKKINLKLLMRRKRKNFQRHNGFIKFTCLKYWMELTEKLL